MYFIVTYFYVPVDPYSTSKKNFFSNPNNIAQDENAQFARNLRLLQLKRANIILDIKNKKIVKCRGTQKDGSPVTDSQYDELYSHFEKQYPKQFEAVQGIIKHESEHN